MTKERGVRRRLELPEGVGAPEIRVNAEPGPEAGEIEVGVELENFELSLTDTESGTTAGHWHLYVDGELQGDVHAAPGEGVGVWGRENTTSWSGCRTPSIAILGSMR